MWSVFLAAALVYESVLKEKSSEADLWWWWWWGGGGGLGWIGWLAIPVQDSSLKKKEIHGKTNGNTWVPKNIEIRAMAMHVNAEP